MTEPARRVRTDASSGCRTPTRRIFTHQARGNNKGARLAAERPDIQAEWADDQSSRRSGGARLSMPRSSSSSLMVSKVSPSSLALASRSGAACRSGSSTSTYFCSEWISSSRRSSGAMAPSPISRSATTGFLSLSRATVIGAPAAIMRARCADIRTRSKRLSIFSMQSSTVTRATNVSRTCGMSGGDTRAAPPVQGKPEQADAATAQDLVCSFRLQRLFGNQSLTSLIDAEDRYSPCDGIEPPRVQEQYYMTIDPREKVALFIDGANLYATSKAIGI